MKKRSVPGSGSWKTPSGKKLWKCTYIGCNRFPVNYLDEYRRLGPDRMSAISETWIAQVRKITRHWVGRVRCTRLVDVPATPVP